MKKIKLKGRPNSNWGLGTTDLILRNFQDIGTAGRGEECWGFRDLFNRVIMTKI